MDSNQLVCGGDIRRKENKWAILALQEANLPRVPRENECRKVVTKLVVEAKLCLFAVNLWCTVVCQGDA